MKFLITFFALLTTTFGFAQITASSFAAAVNYTSGTSVTSHPYFSTSGDLDGDGKIELLVPNSGDNTISIFRNTSTPGTISATTFAAKTDIASLTLPQRICIADLDGDLKQDVVIFYGGSSNFSVLRNTTTAVGSITFAARQDFVTPTSGQGTVADLDGDGKAEVMNINYLGNLFYIYRNSSTGIGSITFASVQSYATAGGPAYIVAKDFDGDGKQDVAVTNYSGTGANTVYVYKNNTTVVGSIIIGSPISLTTGSLPNGLISADIDGDGKYDLIAGNYSGASLSVYRNTSTLGAISFATQVNFATTGSNGPQEMGVADFDSDGKTDLVVGNTNGTNNVSVFRNTASSGTITTSSFATRVDFATGAGAEAAVGDFDGDGLPDILSSNNLSNTVSILRNLIVTAPNVGPTSINFTAINNNNITVNIGKGNGARRIVLCKASSAVNAAPVNGNSYTANSVFASGSQIGTGNYVVYSDTGTSFNVSGLTANTTYNFAVFEYNGLGASTLYLTTAFSYITGSQATSNITYYFSKATGNLNSLGTWGTNTDGSGTAPSSFSTANSYYYVWNNFSPTINGNLTITGGHTAFILGDGVNTYNFSIPAGYTLTTDTMLVKKFSTITISGALAGSINVFEDTTTAQFLNTSTQNIPTASYYNLVAGSSVKTLYNGNVVARNSLTMLSSINLNSFVMMIGTATTQLGTLNYVSGTIYGGVLWRWFTNAINTGTTGLFPIGTATSYLPVQINYTTAPSTGGALSAQFSSAIPNYSGLPTVDFSTSPIITINKSAKNGTWLLATGGVLTGGQFTTTLTGNGFYGVTSYADLRLIRRTNSAAAWTLTGTAQVGTGSNASPSVSRTGMNAFGEFGIGGDSNVNSLPVKLIILSVQQANNDAVLTWQTASEINSDYFEIERSVNNVNWDLLGKVGAAGNSNEIKSYHFINNISDIILKDIRTIYYRLKQVDKDGYSVYSNVFTLQLKPSPKTIIIYPIPLNKSLKVLSSTNESINGISIFDVGGKELVRSENNEIDVNGLAEGIYILRVTTDSQVFYEKIKK